MTFTSTHSIDSHAQPQLFSLLSQLISQHPQIEILSYISSHPTINPSNTRFTIQFPTLELQQYFDNLIHPQQ